VDAMALGSSVRHDTRSEMRPVPVAAGGSAPCKTTAPRPRDKACKRVP
jgi:hypothetical protein